ncbi:MAG TPA: exosortase A [Vicinamibacterales bacterium]|nr:exosortase A [Vicinamibacterales bacterium]
MTLDAKKIFGVALVAGGIVLVYWQVFARLIDAWIVDGNYSHGWLIIPIAAYFVWERRAKLAATPLAPTWFGLVVFAGGILVLLAGLLGSELFLSRVSLILTLAGIVLFLFGWAHLRIVAFPLAFLLLMIPLPAIVFNRIAFPLQLVASRFGESIISAASIPVLREGNVLVLANTTLEVAEACSGIRSLVSLITLGLVFGYFADPRGWVRALIVASTIPVAIISNGARVAGTGILAHFYGSAAAEGFFHEFSGWAVFIVAFLLILAIQRVILRLAPKAPATSQAMA